MFSIANTDPPEQPLWRRQLVLAICIFLACLVGIFSRPIGYSAAFWPANAIMLGLLLRNPDIAKHPTTWLFCWLAFLAADGITGSTLFITLTLNAGNVAGVLAAWAFLAPKGQEVLRFQRQRSVLMLFSGCVIGALVSAGVGSYPSSIAFNVPLGRSVAMWLATEFYNLVLITPLILAAPQGWFWQWPRSLKNWSLIKLLPLLTLIISEMLSMIIGGPGAIAFIMPSLVWAAMTYGVFPITVLNLVVCFGKTAIIATGALSFTPEHVWEVASYHTGLALLSLAPLAVACAYELRMQTLQKLSHLVNYDFLTGVLGRRSFMERAQKLLTRLTEEKQPVAVFMADIDHFKNVNDRYGHAQGDVTLQKFASIARDALRPDDLLGRMGGEEFAIVLPRTNQQQALAVGQRLCQRLREHSFMLPNEEQMRVTLSIGMHAVGTLTPKDDIEHLLARADEALYIAKHNGRNQVRQYVPPR